MPDRLLAFMESNDLPVFIDKKQYNTIRYRRPVNLSKQINIKVANLQNWGTSTGPVKPSILTTGAQTSARPIVTKTMTLELERKKSKEGRNADEGLS